MESYRLSCSEVWGGYGAIDQCVETAGLSASLYSAAVGGGRGGDIHYMSVCDNDLITRIALADVSGHGESVTLISSWVYASLRAQMNSLAGNDVLTELNARICEYGFEAITTATILTYDFGSHCLYFSSAGHPASLVWRSADGWRRLENLAVKRTSNMSMGIQRTAVYEQSELTLKPGDRILMFTDRLLDAESPSAEPFGESRLLHLLTTLNATTISSHNREILKALSQHTGGAPLDDDITILAAEVR